jgi:hypothetical protein
MRACIAGWGGAVPEGRELELAGLDEVGCEVVLADEDRRGQGFAAIDLGIQLDDRKGGPGRSQHQPAGEIGQAQARVLLGDNDERIQGVGNAVAVLVGVGRLDGIKAEEVELLARGVGRSLNPGVRSLFVAPVLGRTAFEREGP